MRTLYIVRHAKSSWAEVGMDDENRPLNQRGLKDAPMMAARFAGRNEPVDTLLSSPALRAITTANAFAEALSMDAPQQIEKLYLASSNTLLSSLNELPRKVKSAMIFGHNPGLSVLVDDLTGNGIGDMPTCAMARIDLDVDNWEEVSKDSGLLIWSDTPKGE